jgi:hypothetical protein
VRYIEPREGAQAVFVCPSVTLETAEFLAQSTSPKFPAKLQGSVHRASPGHKEEKED